MRGLPGTKYHYGNSSQTHNIFPGPNGKTGHARAGWAGSIRAGRVSAAAACLVVLILGGWLLFHQPDADPISIEGRVSPVEAVGHLGRKLIDPLIVRAEEPSLLSVVSEPLFAEAERLAMDARSIRGYVMTLFPVRFLSRDWDD